MGPPPPLHVYGITRMSVSDVPTNASNVSTRHASRLDEENSHSTAASTPGKKYGTRPKWRPMKKYFRLVAKRPTSSGLVSISRAAEPSVDTVLPRSQPGAPPSNGKEP